MKADSSAYLASWANELEARAGRVRNLIGDAHWVSDGSHKEALLREFLRRYLPPGLVISNGFVRTPSAENCISPEVDILVIDPSTHSPFFAEGELQIVPPSSVVAHVEVKSTFSSETLGSALANIYQTQMVIGKKADASKVWRCICFYTMPESRTAETVLKTIEESIKSLLMDSKHLRDNDFCCDYLPTCIATVSEQLIFIDRDTESMASLRLRLFELASLSLACALADLFSSARRWLGGDVVGELDELICDLDIPKPTIHSITF